MPAPVANATPDATGFLFRRSHTFAIVPAPLSSTGAPAVLPAGLPGGGSGGRIPDVGARLRGGRPRATGAVRFRALRISATGQPVRASQRTA